MTSLTLIRGVPGSGKSTLAKQLKLARGAMVTEHFEADMFFMQDGEYKYDGMKIGEAHAWCQTATDDALFYKRDVIVSNTFTTIRELRPYFEMAKEHKIVPQVIHCQNEFGSIHGVPEEVLVKMRARFTHDITPLYEMLNEKD